MLCRTSMRPGYEPVVSEIVGIALNLNPIPCRRFDFVAKPASLRESHCIFKVHESQFNLLKRVPGNGRASQKIDALAKLRFKG